MKDWYGPWFRWFAWRPVKTHDRGWRWLRPVWRQARYSEMDQFSASWFSHSVKKPEAAA